MDVANEKHEMMRDYDFSLEKIQIISKVLIYSQQFLWINWMQNIFYQ